MTTPAPSFAPSSRYRLLERIAVGGMGEIFLAHDTVLDRRVVIKYLLYVVGADEDRVAMFLDEARAVARCDHNNVVKIFDIGVDRERYFMALEHLEGWDLSQVAKRAAGLASPVPIGVVVRLMMDAALGLHAAHEARAVDGRPLQLVHRDVTPRNLFVVREGILKLLDFGIAKSDLQRAATEVGHVKGTLAYMSPEQVTSQPLDRRSDIFALGIILHELLSGARLFKRSSSEAMMFAIARDPIPPPHRESGLSDAMVSVVNRALSRDPAMRFPTTVAFADALERAASGKAASRESVAEYLKLIFLDSTDVTPEPIAPHAATRAHALSDELIAALPSGKTAPTVDLGNEVRARPAVPGRRRPWAVAGAAFALTLVVAGGALYTLRAPNEPVAAVAPEPESSPTQPIVAAVAPEPPNAPVAAVAEAPRIKERHEPAAKHRPPIAAKEVGPALLTIQSEPWANVYIDGTFIGASPLVEHALPAGKVRVRLSNPDLGLERTTVVDAKPGKVTRMRFDLRAGEIRVIP